MKKPVAILLLLVVCLLSSMLPLRYGLKLAGRMLMERRMHAKDAGRTSILIAESDLGMADWEDAREFRLNGHLYDVAGTEFRGGIRYYRCIPDELETGLERGADAFAGHMLGQGRSRAEGRIARSLLDWLQGLYFSEPHHICTANSPESRYGYFPRGAESLADAFAGRLIIPPEA